MNPVLIVLPILFILMVALGLEFTTKDFLQLAKHPKAVWIGLVAQIVILPLIAVSLGLLFNLTPYFFIGLVLIGCSPGGSSSNIFSLIAKGDISLSVTLTALSSVITIFTIPPIMMLTMQLAGMEAMQQIHLPVGKLFVQNIVLMLFPIVLGMGLRKFWPAAAAALKKVLGKMAFPALLLLAGVFFIAHREAIIANFSSLTLIISIMILAAMGVGALLAKASKLPARQKRTIVIEVGMQNAAQAIAIACSPFAFNNNVIGIPAIIYALMMNVVLLTYIGKYMFKKRSVAAVEVQEVE